MSNAETEAPVDQVDPNGEQADPSEPQSSAEAAVNDDATASRNEGNAANDADENSIHAKLPQFSNLSDTAKATTPAAMSRFLDVSVQVSAELGSIKMPIGDVLQLSEGSVIELNRNLSEPVDLVAQGVRIARGEVVVIDDCFAIRIREIESNEEY